MSKKSNLAIARARLDNKLRLTSYGYNIHKSDALRQRALQAASVDNNPLIVLRKLSLIHDHQHIPAYKEIYSRDVGYMKNIYSDYKRKINARDNIKLQSQIGSAQYLSEEIGQDTVDVDQDNNNNNVIMTEINTIVDRQKVCDADGKCGVRNVFKETYTIDGKTVQFSTLDITDADQILDLDIKYLDSDTDMNTTIAKIKDNIGLLIGIKIDDKLEGYCLYDPLENNQVKIVWFCANKGYGTLLYKFMEKYFKLAGYTKILIVVSIQGSYATQRINFWNKVGFRTYESIPEKYKIHMEKNI